MAPVKSPLPLLILSALAALIGCSGETNGLDKVDGGQQCANDDNCPQDQHCENGTCAAGSGNQCTMTSECRAGEECKIITDCGASRCHGNTCEPKTCTDSSECNGWYCDMTGHCAEPPSCTMSSQCPPGFTCGANGVCTYTPSTTCTGDSMCPMNTICVGMQCVTPQACTDSSGCPMDQRCIQMECRDPCTSNGDCGSAIYACDMMSGECVQRCNNDSVCPDGTICEMFLCTAAECTTDAECTGAGMFECQGEENGHGRCVEIIMCDAPGGCPPGTACNMTTNRCEQLPECVGDRDCQPDEYCDGGYCQPSATCDMNTPCGMGFDCVGGTCVPELCRGNADCTMGDVCIAGECKQPPPTNTITQVRILTPAGVVRPGTTYRFVAVALDQTGAIIPGVHFVWMSSVTGIATIDSDGLATGGNTAGTTLITATVNTHSASANLLNLGPLDPNDVRVTVLAASGGAPVVGGTVDLDGPTTGALSQSTDMDGVATFTNIDPMALYSVTVGADDFDFVSIIDIDARDVLIALPPVTKPSSVGGIKGSVDFTNVTSMDPVSLSLNGASIASPLVAFQPASLFGGELFTIDVPMLGAVPVPAASTLTVEFLGTPFTLKDTYYARATTGIRGAWSFSGRLGLDVVRNPNGNIVGAILPYLQRFTHGVRPVVDVVALPTVVDTNDIDGDGDSMEMVPDYTHFPDVGLTPDTAQSLRYNLAVDNLPVVSGGNANTLIVVGGVLLPSVGFVPLGLDGLQDMAGNGIVPPFNTKIAPPHGGLEVGDYAVLATAVRLAGTALPGPGSARLLVASRLPEDVDMSDGWLDSPIDATWNSMNREVALPAIQNADMYRIAFASEDGTWHVFVPAAAMADTVSIPPVPSDFVDRTNTGTISVDAIDLEAGQSVSTVFELSSGGVLALDHATRGFARANIGP